MIPHPEKAHKGGEDASFFSASLLTVADGVGGWADQGVDPALYSRSIIKAVSTTFNAAQEKYIKNLKDLVVVSAGQVKVLGSSTLVVAALDPQGTLRTANIGDSGYLIVRPTGEDKFELIFESKEQTHGFNFPFQIGSSGDSPASAELNSHELEKGDIVVLGTDGVFDNIDKKEVKAIIEEQVAGGELNPIKIANKIGEKAFKASLDQNHMSPFAKAAKRYGYRFIGGKSDDITIIVARVV